MSRIPTPKTNADAPAAAQPLLEDVKKSLGSTPNLFRLVANSPAALKGYLGLNGALGTGALDAATRERIALAIGQINGCDYCLAAHSYIATNVAKLTVEDITAARRGRSADPRANAAVQFAVKVATNRGAVGAADVEAVKAAGYSDGEVVEIVAHVALNTLTNYVNRVFDTEIDFPPASKAA